jgi:hypothetical protein
MQQFKFWDSICFPATFDHKETINHYLKMIMFEVLKRLFPGTCRHTKQEGGSMYILTPKQIHQMRRLHKLIKFRWKKPEIKSPWVIKI